MNQDGKKYGASKPRTCPPVVQNSGRDPPRGVPRGVLKGGGVVQEEGDEK